MRLIIFIMLTSVFSLTSNEKYIDNEVILKFKPNYINNSIKDSGGEYFIIKQLFK